MVNKTEDMIKIANEIAYKIINGIKIDEDTTRPFDPIDMYELIGNRNFNDFLDSDFADKLSNLTFTTYAKKYMSYERTLQKEFFLDRSRNVIINAKILVHKPLIESKDNGDIYEWVEGTGDTVTEEDKKFIINYLKENNIPLTFTTFNAAIIRLSKGYIEKPKQKVMKKNK